MKKVISLIIILLFSTNFFAQEIDKKTIKKLFLDAEYYVMYNQYEQALPIYLEIYKDSYQADYNANLNFRIGQCYMQDPLKNYNAHKFLEQAVKDITLNYREGSASETQAPPEAFLLLGNSYRLVFEFDKAVYAYHKFEEYLDVSEVQEIAKIERLVQSCRNAKDLLLLSDHNFVEVSNLGKIVNTAYSEYNPVISQDESTLVFTSKRNYNLEEYNKLKEKVDKGESEPDAILDYKVDDEEIFISKRVNNSWSSPINISGQLNADPHTSVVSISHDGNLLLLKQESVGLGNLEQCNLFVARYESGRWSNMEKLEKNINSKDYETHGCFSPDNKTIYFSSDRSDGYGGIDIYKSKQAENGEWEPAKNLGPAINTEFNEECPSILSDGKTLFFSSEGHYNMGGYDIFYSKELSDNSWSVPINVGFPVNTMEDDLNFFPIKNGTEAYVSLASKKGVGLDDIYKVKISTGIDFDAYMKRNTPTLAEIQDEGKGDYTLKNKLGIDESGNETNISVMQLTPIEASPELTGTEIIRAGMKDVNELLKNARKLKKDADIAFLIAEEKNLLSKDKRKEADAILAAADTIMDEELRNFEILKALQINKEADLLSIMAYNLAKKLDETANEFRDYALEAQNFVEDLKKDSLIDVNILLKRLNDYKEELNKKLLEFSSLDAELTQRREDLTNKARKLAFHQNKLEIIKEEIQIVQDTLNSRFRRIAAIDSKIENTDNGIERELLTDDKEQFVAELKYLRSEMDKLKEKQFNSISGYQKINQETKVLTNNVVLLQEFNDELITNNDPIPVLAKKATRIKEQLYLQLDLKAKTYEMVTVISTDITLATYDMEDFSLEETFKDLKNTLDYTPAKPADTILASNQTEVNDEYDILFDADKDLTVDIHSDATKDTTGTEVSVDLAEANSSEVTAENNNVDNTESNEVTNNTSDTNTETADTNEITTEPTETESKLIEITGNVSLQDNKEMNNSFKVDIVELESYTKVAIAKLDIVQGNYSCLVKPGSYRITFSGDGYTKKFEMVDIPEHYNRKSFVVNTELVPEEVATGEYYVSKAIFFEFGSSSLEREAKIELEKLFKLMEDNPSLYFEVLGYTDSKGGADYNRLLANKRAKASVNYLVNRGVDRKRFVAKGLGESNFIAINTNPDGSDNPEGRKYNRRVEIKILNSTNDKIYTNQPDIPEHLLYSEKNGNYTIHITTEKKDLPADFFNKYGINELKSIKRHSIKKGVIYTVGQYNNRSEALTLLNNIVDLGYKEAKIIDYMELDKMKKSFYDEIKQELANEESSDNLKYYTIQLKAIRSPADPSAFENLKGVTEKLGEDNIYRYTYKQFNSYSEAQKELGKLNNQGFEDAFIIDLDGPTSEQQPLIGQREPLYTIQISTIKVPKPLSFFKGLNHVTEHIGKDKLYRYSYGSYYGISGARRDLDKIKELGYHDAFIININRYNSL